MPVLPQFCCTFLALCAYGPAAGAERAQAPVIDRTCPLEDAAEAIRQIAGGHATGKGIVII